MPYTVGARLDRYEIIAPLGAGGMGEVYLARDTRLDRKVALKILPSSYGNNADRVRRFEQEAKAISALNHPNIITIYEVGHAEGVHFIATEFIEGQTLRRKMRQERINIGEALEIAIQIVNALAAAHSAGILHRDIKPENVMLRPDGYVKVLDFGLAKLAERGAGFFDQLKSDDEADLSDLENIETDPGMILGTATYMSPEQARAQKLDARSDLFSLGIIIYEMIAGRSPFHDQTASDVMAAILQRTPMPLSRYTHRATPELERVVSKMLTKDRERRYQSAGELLSDLKSLRQNNSFERHAHRAVHPSAPTDRLDQIDGAPAIQDLETKIELIGQETRLSPPPTNTSATIILSEIKKHKTGAVIALLLVIAFAVGVGVVAHRLSAVKPNNFPNMNLTRLAATGSVIDAALSPDGKYAAYIIDTGEKQGLWIKQVSAQGPSLQLVPPVDVRFRAPTFSRDGNQVFYVMRTANGATGDLYRIPTLGGPSLKICSGVSSPVAISPDNSQVGFVQEAPDQGVSALIVADVFTGHQREIARRTLPDSFSVDGPSWSPNGEVIVCPIANFKNGFTQQVAAINLSDGAVKIITKQSWPNIGRIGWLPDGKGLMMPARETDSLTRQIWLISYPDGQARRITNDLNDYRGLTLTSDGSTLSTVQITQLSNIWVAPAGNLTQTRQITSGAGNHDGVQGLAWTADGKIVYTSNAGGKPSLWVVNADGSNQQQFSADAATNNLPSATTDGRYMVFNSDRSGQIAVWRINRDGSNLKQLTFGQLDLDPQASTNGWVVFSSIKSGKRTLWKVPIEGGDSTQITDKLSEFPVVSPDGKFIACVYRDDEKGAPSKISVIPFTGGAPIKGFDIPTNPWRLVRWSPDGQSLIYVETQNGVSNLWSQPIFDGKPKKLTNFLTERISSFAWSLDGKNLALARGVETREIVLISNFK